MPKATASTIDWGGAINAIDRESDLSTPLDASYVFYLGFFEDFTPTSDNVSEWAEHWTTIDAVNYNATYSVFNARHRVTASDPAGEQAYIWGVRRSRENMEWILITDPSWIWPSVDTFARKKNWLVGSATVAVVGSINGESYQMVTAPVSNTASIPVITYEMWTKKFFADGDSRSSSSADPDGNGIDNLTEFALDQNPVKNESGALFTPQALNSPSEAELPEAAQNRYLGVIVQPSLDADVQILGWLSTDLTFTDNVTAAVIETLPDGSLLIRDPEALGNSNTRKFLRLEFLEN
ncbi:hypothetical protein [Cerasicoccus maritimus]|uniref:hypothetical protein n=1 Tax=Cerasicoccus maritimus TaxID=490089 RepID=UPI0028524B76|nr:hypothetical protein [Cerasicoccus maritimus]